jgi:hypothetical protein
MHVPVFNFYIGFYYSSFCFLNYFKLENQINVFL